MRLEGKLWDSTMYDSRPTYSQWDHFCRSICYFPCKWISGHLFGFVCSWFQMNWRLELGNRNAANNLCLWKSVLLPRTQSGEFHCKFVWTEKCRPPDGSLELKYIVGLKFRRSHNFERHYTVERIMNSWIGAVTAAWCHIVFFSLYHNVNLSASKICTETRLNSFNTSC